MKKLLQMVLISLFFIQCSTDKKPNVIIIYTDDQGTLDAACYGAEDLYTPNLDELAKSGILFTQAYAQTVYCPSRAALLTGRHPQRSGINNWTQNDAHVKKKGVNMPLIERHKDQPFFVMQPLIYLTILNNPILFFQEHTKISKNLEGHTLKLLLPLMVG